MELPPGCRLSLEDRPDAEDCAAINTALGEYNKPFLIDPGFARFAVFVRDETGAIRGGLDAFAYAGWLFVRTLWIEDALRGRGVGRELIARAEERALAVGCHSVYLDTFSFQAPGFYQKLGYQVFGTLDYPPGHQRYFLQKRLALPEG